MFVLAIVLSLLGLALGPALVALGRGRGRALASSAIDGLTLGLVPLFLLLRLMPHLYEASGAVVLALAALGYGAFSLAERRSPKKSVRVGRALIVPALTLHSLLDGAALGLAFAAGGGVTTSPLLAAALVLHRLPEGLFLATTLTPELGLLRASYRVAAVGAATVLGAFGGHAMLARVPEASLGYAIAFGLGAMLWLVTHRRGSKVKTPRARAASGAFFLLGLLLVLVVPSPDSVLHLAQPRELSLLESLGPLFVETAPSLLFGLLGAGLLHAFFPRHLGSWLRGGSAPSQALRGVLFGLPLPVCSCGLTPLLRRLLLGGAPVAAVIAFTIATPELEVGGAALSLRLLGVPFTAARIGASLVAAILVALLVAAVARPPVPHSTAQDSEPEVASTSIPMRLRLAVTEAFGPALDHVAAWFVIGLLLAAIIEAGLQPGLLAHLGAPFDVIAAAVLAIPAYVCAQGATPIAAVVVHKGGSLGAALAFLMVGPATNLPVLGAIRRHLGFRAALAFAVGNLGVAVLAGLVVNVVVQRSTVPEIHALVAHQHFGIEWVCALGLGLLLVASLLRLGPRAWFGAMFVGDHDHPHAHDVQRPLFRTTASIRKTAPRPRLNNAASALITRRAWPGRRIVQVMGPDIKIVKSTMPRTVPSPKRPR